MPPSSTWLDYPVFDHAWPKEEKETQLETRNILARDSVITMQAKEYFNRRISGQLDTPPVSPLENEMRLLPLPSPTSTHSATSRLRQQSLESELRILNVELAKCQMTRDALARREAALLELRAEVEEEIKLKAETEAEERERQEEEEEEDDLDEVLFMRNVQKRVEDGLKTAGAGSTGTSDATRAEHNTRDTRNEHEETKKGKSTKPSPINTPNGHAALPQRNPKLAP